MVVQGPRTGLDKCALIQGNSIDIYNYCKCKDRISFATFNVHEEN